MRFKCDGHVTEFIAICFPCNCRVFLSDKNVLELVWNVFQQDMSILQYILQHNQQHVMKFSLHRGIGQGQGPAFAMVHRYKVRLFTFSTQVHMSY